jgi:hypothetical protein
VTTGRERGRRPVVTTERERGRRSVTAADATTGSGPGRKDS